MLALETPERAAAIRPALASKAVKPVAAPPRRRVSWRLLAGALLALGLVAGAVALGLAPRLRQKDALAAAAREAAAAPPRVHVATARPAPADADRVLPGNAQPLLEASLFARATGYIKTRRAEIGDRVQEGQLLALIDAPDIDDQLRQARANLEQAHATLKLNEANATLARTILARSVNLNGKGAGIVSQEELDQQRATVAATAAGVENARASIQVNEAAVQRFADLQAFEQIKAPFTGVVTARNIDTGDLVSADSTTRELFHLMRTDVLRVFVNVPQVFATDINVGQAALIHRREDPLVQYTGTVTRTADALDPATRTLLTEVQVPNSDNALRPGMYLQVKFVFKRHTTPVLVPSAALATGAQGPRLAVLDQESRVHYQAVQLGRDFGAEVEVVAGLQPGATVVFRPGDALPEGMTVIAEPAR